MFEPWVLIDSMVAVLAHRYVVGAALVAMAASALIVQNKGGGHGEIGYHLALKLAKEKGLKVIWHQFDWVYCVVTSLESYGIMASIWGIILFFSAAGRRFQDSELLQITQTNFSATTTNRSFIYV